MMKFLNINLNSRVVGLDIMRAIAILLVVFGHYHQFFYKHLHLVIPGTNLSVNRGLAFFINGFDGVDLFFVLSGFLIGHSLLLAHKQSKLTFNYLVHNFWIKRWYRTLPNYFAVLFTVILVFYLLPGFRTQSQNPDLFYKYFIFIQNFFNGELAFFPESWSLSIEEWFYILFPLVLTIATTIFSKFNFQKWILLIIIIMYVISGNVFRVNYLYSHEILDLNFWNGDIRTSVVMRFDAIIYGVLMAFIKLYFPNRFRNHRYLFLVAGITILAVSFKYAFFNTDRIDGYKFMHGYYFAFVGVGMAMFLPFFFYLNVRSKRLTNFFVVISVLSYSIYLTNYTLIQHLVEKLYHSETFLSSVAKCLSALLLTTLVSVLLYKYIETPFMKLRSKILHE